MKKIVKFIIVTTLCISCLTGMMSLPIVVNAEEEPQVESRMTYIASYSTDLSISSTGVASITGRVRGKTGVTSSYVKCTLQMSVGGGWVDVKSWEDSSSTPNATVGVDYQLSSRGTYRVSMECRANTEEKTGTSAYRTY
ncbi:MAG: hypothetical protein J6A80_00695 [Lachnospiraceae bacterium]|nr:hypothetical protein [Lachnospiraceae bacterium]